MADSDVVLLLHMNGGNNSTTFTDSSFSNKTVTAQGDAKISTAQYKWNGSSGYFDGTGDYLSCTTSSDFDFSSSDFTVELWWRTSNVSLNQAIACKADLQATPYKGWTIRYDPTASPAGLRLVLFKGDVSNLSDVFQYEWVPVVDTWYHLAFVRSGTTAYVFVNGTLLNSGTISNATTIASASTRNLLIGAQDSFGGASGFHGGYLQDVRITKEIALYTGNFTAPSELLPDPSRSASASPSVSPSASPSSSLSSSISPSQSPSSSLSPSASLSPSSSPSLSPSLSPSESPSVSPSIEPIFLSGSVTLPEWTADGEISESGISGTVALPQWTADGWVGVTGQPELSEWTAAGTVTTPDWVTGSVELSEWTASGTIQTQTIARASVMLPMWTAAGNTGAVAEVSFPVWTAGGTISNPARLSGAATLPRWVGTGTVTTGSVVSGAVTLSAWTATGDVPNGSWVAGTATLPAWTAYGYLDGAATGAITETTYAINLSTGAVTQLLLGAFDKLVTAHGRLYGLRDGMLIRLDGDDDSGTAIAATIRFAPQQFGTYLAKRLDGTVYLNAREDDGVTLTLVQDEVASWVYRTSTDASPGMGTHRIKVGRGITFHSLGLVLENRDGGRLDVGGLEVPVYPLSRRPR